MTSIRNKGPHLLVMLLLGLLLTSCSPGTAPHEQQTEQSNLAVSIVPEIVDRATGTVLLRQSSAWRGHADAKNGRFTNFIRETSGPALAPPEESWTVPDSTVAQVVEDYGFTPAAHPDYVAAVSPATPPDTVSYTSGGVDYLNIYVYGTNGQPEQIYLKEDGVLLSELYLVWQTVSGGYQLTQVVDWDYSAPDVYIRTTITATSGTTVIFTHGPASGTLWAPASVEIHSPDLLAQFTAGAESFAAVCADLFAGVFLPTELHAQGEPCLGAWVNFVAAIFTATGAATIFASNPNPVTYLAYIAARAWAMSAGRGVLKKCGYT